MCYWLSASSLEAMDIATVGLTSTDRQYARLRLHGKLYTVTTRALLGTRRLLAQGREEIRHAS